MKSPRGFGVRRLVASSLVASVAALGAAGCDDGKATGPVQETPHAAETTKNMESFMKTAPKAAPTPAPVQTK